MGGVAKQDAMERGRQRNLKLRNHGGGLHYRKCQVT